MNLSKTEREAYKVVRAYRERVDRIEDKAIKSAAVRYAELERGIRRDLRSLTPDDHRRPPIVTYRTELEHSIERRVKTFADSAEETMLELARETARLGAETADKSARRIAKGRDWVKVKARSLVSGPVVKASVDALRKLPGVIMDRLEHLVEQAAALGLTWLLTQVRETFGSLWRNVQRTLRTLAEQMFRRGQHEQAQRTPVIRWLRIANHETACFACLMLEGTVYDRREDFADHPNGRCTIIPIEDDHPEEHPGRDWFERLDPEEQRRIMGPSRYDAWQNGDLSLDDLVEVVNDPTFGPIPHMIPLDRLGLR